MADKTINQVNFQDNQSFKIDIEKIYLDFIKDIDNTRSYVNITNKYSIDNLYKAFLGQSNTPNTIMPETTYQESRCHAFYRMIGFPVVSKSKKIYNPGLDLIKDPNRTIRIAGKIDIAKDALDGFNDLSIKRENYINSILKIFSSPSSLTASVFALTSGSIGKKGPNIRQFESTLDKVPDAFDTNVDNQSYKIEALSLIGEKEIPLSQYKGSDGSSTNSPDLFSKKKHIIAPFIVDPRIDFTVSPSSRQIAVPFVLSDADTKLSPETFVKRPLLEKIIRERFSQSSKESDTGTASEKLINYIKDVSAVNDQDIINQISKDLYKLSPQYQFVKYISIIREMMTQLIDSVKIIQKTQSLYYWIPQLKGTIGPETVADARNVILINKDNDPDLITSADFNIILKSAQAQMNQLNAQLDPTKSVKSNAGFVFGTSFDSDSSDALGDRIQESADNLNKKRKKDIIKANEALRTIEIIMGEFSGLGLCDIIAIMATLYTMPKDNLLGFLDDDAFARMKIELSLELESLPHPGIDPAMNSFFSTIKDYYNLMQKIYNDLYHTQGLNT